jgi:hypothetical protein
MLTFRNSRSFAGTLNCTPGWPLQSALKSAHAATCDRLTASENNGLASKKAPFGFRNASENRDRSILWLTVRSCLSATSGARPGFFSKRGLSWGLSQPNSGSGSSGMPAPSCGSSGAAMTPAEARAIVRQRLCDQACDEADPNVYAVLRELIRALAPAAPIVVIAVHHLHILIRAGVL